MPWIPSARSRCTRIRTTGTCRQPTLPRYRSQLAIRILDLFSIPVRHGDPQGQQIDPVISIHSVGGSPAQGDQYGICSGDFATGQQHFDQRFSRQRHQQQPLASFGFGEGSAQFGLRF